MNVNSGKCSCTNDKATILLYGILFLRGFLVSPYKVHNTLPFNYFYFSQTIYPFKISNHYLLIVVKVMLRNRL